MGEEHSLNDASRKLVVETMELIIVALGIAVIGYLGWMVLMPMAVALFFYFPCAFAIDMAQRIRNSLKR